MKKSSLLCLVLTAAMSLSAQQPYQRITGAGAGSIKTLNTAGHSLKAKPKTMLAAKVEAPANAVEVPFTHDLGKNGSAETANYTIINVDNDSRTWKVGLTNGYGSCMAPNEIDANNDWLITVPIHMAPGDYVLSFELGYMSGTGVELDVKMGTAPTIEAMTTEIMPTTKVTVKDMTKYEFNCPVAEEGYYYIGFHSTTTKAMKSATKLTNVSVKAGTIEPPVVVDPPESGTLTYELAPKGELKATLTYTAPTKTKGGKDLTEITKVLLTSRWEVDKFTFENVKPGQVITQDVELYAGINNRFTAVAYVGDVASDKIEYKSIWAGPDTPLAPENVHLTVSKDFMTATLSWDAVGETGEHGGYVDPEAVTYYIFDAFGSYYDPAIAQTGETSYTLSYPQLNGQDFFAYQVTAGYGENYSLDNTSNIAIVGKPSPLPFTESFAGGLYDGMWLSDQSSTQGGQQMGTITDDYFASLFDPEDPEAPKPLASQDGDNGFHFWLPYETDVRYGLISVRADISAAAHPVLEFWYQGQGNVIEVLAGTDLEDLETIETIDLKAKPTTDWTQARIALDKYKEAGAVMFELLLIARDNDDEHTWSIPLDNIRVRALAEKDLHIVTMTGATYTKVGNTIKYTAHVENLGTLPAVPSISWEINGKSVKAETGEEIAPNGFADYTFEYEVPLNAPDELTLSFKSVLAGDATPADNERKATIAVSRASFATITDLSATDNGNEITLTWSKPVIGEPTPETLTEDFENPDYTPMSISGAGAWTVHDGDGVKTYNVFRELYNPYQTMPLAFQLFDNVVANIPEIYQPDAEAHSGQRFMLGASAQSALNDNWLISPELSGNAQTVTFWAKSFSVSWPETFEVYYSTTDNAPDSFTTKVETIEGTFLDGTVPEVWTQYTVTLPAGAKYFAIHHNSDDTVALFIDDVTYEAAPTQPADLAIDHYEIFCNGEKTGTSTDTSFTHKPFNDDTADGDYDFEYVVVPVYNHGAVAPSNTASVHIAYSGIEQITTADLDATTILYRLDGVHVDSEMATPGLYIIVKGGKAAKAIIK